jgi:hypothetical protein
MCSKYEIASSLHTPNDKFIIAIQSLVLNPSLEYCQKGSGQERSDNYPIGDFCRPGHKTHSATGPVKRFFSSTRSGRKKEIKKKRAGQLFVFSRCSGYI